MDGKASPRGLRARRRTQAALILLIVATACRRDDPSVGPDDARALAPKKATDPLEGRWVSEVTKREVEAKLSGDAIEFRVVDSKDWDGAYADGEVRFSIRHGQNGALEVIDLYRPAVPKGSAYTPDAMRSCLFRVTELPGGAPLRATVGPDGVMSVEFAAVTMQQIPAEGGISRIEGCRGQVVTGKITSTLHRKPGA